MTWNRYLAVAVVMIFLAFGHGRAEGLGGGYTAESHLLVKATTPALQSVFRPPYSERESETFKRTQQELIKNRFVLLFALRTRNVQQIPVIQELQKSGDPVKYLQNQIKVRFPGGGDVMAVSCTMSTPRDAAVLTNAVVSAYLNEVVNAARDEQRVRVLELEKLASEREQRLRQRWGELRRLSAQKDGKQSSPATEMEMLQVEIKTLEQLLHETRLDCERAKGELRAPPRVVLISKAEEPLSKD